MKAAFTICSNNYLAKALVTAETFKAKHPDYLFFIFLVDMFIAEVSYENFDDLKVIAIKDVVANIEELAEKYNIIELNTAVKPSVFTFLFNNYDFSHILFLDPDLMIFDRFNEVEDLFYKEGFSIIITPHGCSPIDDGRVPSEIDLSMYGLYNLGFLALKKSLETERFLDFWHNRLMKYCYINVERGMFTDQLWVNYAPIYFDGVLIFKHLGYNVANWNLYERQIERIDEVYKVNRIIKLKFFHFSHYKFENPYIISTQQNRHVIEEFEDLRTIIDIYQEKLIFYNHEFYNKIPCYYQLLHEKFNKVVKTPNEGFVDVLRKVKNKTIDMTRRLISLPLKNH
jgi:hypothetical protein